MGLSENRKMPQDAAICHRLPQNAYLYETPMKCQCMN